MGVPDPLIARLPLPPGTLSLAFTPGHLHKRIPAGYYRSLTEDNNSITDLELSNFYHKLRVVVSGPIFSLERWRYIIELNLFNPRFTSSYAYVERFESALLE